MGFQIMCKERIMGKDDREVTGDGCVGETARVCLGSVIPRVRSSDREGLILGERQTGG